VIALQEMERETEQFRNIAQQTLEITASLNRLAEELQQMVQVFQIEESV